MENKRLKNGVMLARLRKLFLNRQSPLQVQATFSYKYFEMPLLKTFYIICVKKPHIIKKNKICGHWKYQVTTVQV